MMERTLSRGCFRFGITMVALMAAGCGSSPDPAADEQSSSSDAAPNPAETTGGESPVAPPPVAPPMRLTPVEPVDLPTPSADVEFREHVKKLYSPQVRELLEEATSMRGGSPAASAVDIRLEVEQKLAAADELRAEAKAYLLSLGGEAIEKLKGAMLDDSVDVRRGAAWFLFENVNPGDPQMVAVFVRALEDKDPLVRRLGVAGLKGLPAASLERFLPQLVGVLEAGKEEATDRAAVAYLIGKIGPTAAPALPSLKKLAKVDADANVRKQALLAATKIASDAESAALFQAALSDSDVSIRKMAASQLGRLGAAATPAVGALAKSLSDDDEAVRLYATQSLGKLGPLAASAAGPLAKSLDDSSEKVRRAAAQSLVNLGAPSVDPLIAQLGSTNPHTRLLALAALGGLGSSAKRAIPTIQKLLNDPDPQVKQGAETVLEVLQNSP